MGKMERYNNDATLNKC